MSNDQQEVTQITDLPQAQTPLSAGDIVLVIQNGVAKQVAQAQVGDRSAITPSELPIATNLLVGGVKVDNSTMTVAPDGTLTSHATVTGTTIFGTPSAGNLTQFHDGTSVTNGDLSGDVTTSGGLVTSVVKLGGTNITGTTGSGNVVFSTSPALVTPNLGTPSTLVGTNITGTAASLTAGNVTVIPTLTGDIQNTGNATTVTEIKGNPINSTTGTFNVVYSNSPVLQTPNLGTPSTIVLTNATGVAPSLTAGALTNQSHNSLAGFDNTGAYGNVTVGTGLDLISGVLTAAAANPTFDDIQSGTSTSKALIVGNGSSLTTSSTGTIVATTLATPQAIGGVNFDGSAAITPQQIQPASESSDTSCFPTFFNAASGTAQQPKYNASFTYNSSTNALTATTFVGALSGNASTVTTNANLTGPITSVGNATSIASQTGTGTTFVMSAGPAITGHPTIEGVTSTGATGTGKFVFDTSPVLVTPNLGTPSAVVLTNASGTASSLTAGHATALANNTANTLAGFDNSGIYGDVAIGTGLTLSSGILSASGSAPAFSAITGATNTSAAMVVGTGSSLTTSGSGTITATAVPASGLTGTTLASGVTASSLTSFGASIALGTPASGTLTNCTGTASGLTAGNVTTNANLTGVITSVGNATSIASQTGTGTKFVVDTSPTLVTPNIGTATGTGLIITSTSASSLVVGPSGVTNPVVTVNSSVASQADGVRITGNASGSGVTLTTTTSGTNAPFKITSAGTGAVKLQQNGADVFVADNAAGSVLNFTTGDNTGLLIDTSASGLNSNVAFKVKLPASGNQFAFSFINSSDANSWAILGYNIGGTGLAGMSLGAGGSSARDLFLYRSAASTLNIGSAAGNSSATVNAGTLSLGTPLALASGGSGTTSAWGIAAYANFGAF